MRKFDIMKLLYDDDIANENISYGERIFGLYVRIFLMALRLVKIDATGIGIASTFFPGRCFLLTLALCAFKRKMWTQSQFSVRIQLGVTTTSDRSMQNIE